MAKIATTICWGLALGIVLSLPDVAPAGASQIPAASPPEAAPPAVYPMAWSTEIAGAGSVHLTAGRSAVLIAAPDQPLRAYRLSDGSPAWEHPASPDGAPAVGSGTVALVDDGQLVVLDETTGAGRWRYPLGEPARQPAVAGDLLLLASGPLLRAFQLGDGREIWQQNLGATAVTSIAIDDDFAAVGLADGTVAGISLPLGTLLWRTEIGAVPAELAAARDRVLFGTSARAVCSLRQHDGSLDWCFPVGVPASGTAAADDEGVYFVLLDNTLRIFDRRSGAMRSREALTARPAGGPMQLADGLAIPLLTGEFVLLPSAPRGRHVLPPPGADKSSRSLQGAAVAQDGVTLISLTVSPGLSRLLTAYRPAVSPPLPAAP